MTKRRGLLKGKDRCQGIGQLLGGGTSFASTATVFVRKQKVRGSQDDGFVGELAIQLVGYAASIFAPMVSKKPGIPHAQPALVSSLAAARISLGDAGRNNPQ
jgi:hypothetical protein